MAAKPKCPECGSDDLKTWQIKNNTMARCNGCKRTVVLGKSEQQQKLDKKTDGGDGTGAEAAAPARGSRRRKRAKRGTRKAGGVPQRTVSQQQPKSDDPIGDAIKRALGWVFD